MPALAALVGKADLAFTRAEGGEDSVCLRHGCYLCTCVDMCVGGSFGPTHLCGYTVS